MAVIRANRIQEMQPQISLIGRLYKGSKKRPGKNGRQVFGEDLTYFRFEPEERLKSFAPMTPGFDSLYDELSDRWAKLQSEFYDYRSIPILLPFNDVHASFPHGNSIWSDKGAAPLCVRRCDGVTTTLWTDENSKGVQRGSKPCAMGENDSECPAGCKAEAQLKMFIPALGYPGIVMLTTHSGKDIKNILSSLMFLESSGYDISKIPMRLCRSLQPCNWHKPDGTIVPQQKWLCSLEIDAQFGVKALQAQQDRYQAAVLGGTSQAQLPAASMPALPASEHYTETMPWFEFQNGLRKARNANSIEFLNQVESQAIAALPAGAHQRVLNEVDQVRSEILDHAPIQPLQTLEATAIAPSDTVSFADRLAQVRKFTEHTKDQVKELAATHQITPLQATKDFDSFFTLMGAMLVDWAKRFDVWNHDQHAINSFQKYLEQEFAEDPESDELWNDGELIRGWAAKVEAKLAEKQAAIVAS